MNKPSPLIPQGSALERKNPNRTRVRLAVFVVLSVHVIGLMALLMQGCRKPPEADSGAQPEVDTNLLAELFDPTNPPIDTLVPPTNVIGEIPPENTVVPLTALPTPTPAPTTATEYTVVAGDNFTRIAQKFPGVTARMIQDANPGVEPTRLQIGQKLQIPPPAPAAVSSGSTISDSGQQVHVVKSGDTLIEIADQYGVTVQALREENNLTTTRIIVGQKLKIPSAPANTQPPTIPPAQ